MKSLFTEDAYQEIKTRIAGLSNTQQAQWGTMDVAQMQAHCCEPIRTALGEITLKKPNFMMQLLFKALKSSFYNDKPWKQGLPTSEEYKVVNSKDFEAEKMRLLGLVDAFYERRTLTEWPPHPLCGHFTPEQWGQMQYKHIDHHLRQFGA